MILSNKYIGVCIVTFSLFLVPILAVASPVLRSGEEVSVASEQIVEGDFYGAGEVATVSGEVQGDVYVAGGTITHNGVITADLVAAGRSIQLHGPVGDDVRAVAFDFWGKGEIVIADEVAGDLVVLGDSIRILSTARVAGDILFLGGDLTIDGPVQGSVYGFGESLSVNASVGGSVDVELGTGINLGDTAELLGNLTYTSPTEMARAQGAVVVGNIQHEPMGPLSSPWEITLLALSILLFASLTLLLFFKPEVSALATRTQSNYGSQGLIGLMFMLATPVVIILLGFSLIGLLVAALLLLVYIGIFLLGWILAGPLMGIILWNHLHKNSSPSVLSVIVGVLLFEALFLIPFIGPLLAITVLFITIGAIVHRIYSRVVS